MLTEILKSYRFNAFIQSWIVMQIQLIAGKLQQDKVLAACQRAMVSIQQGVKLRNDYAVQRGKHLGSDEARQLDILIDRQVSFAHSLLDATIRSQGSLADAATRLMEAGFPRGLGAHVHANFMVQATYNQNLIDALKDPAHAAVVDDLRLERVAAQLAELSDRFNVAAGIKDPVTGAMVHAAEATGQDALMKLVCTIVALFDEANPSELAVREQLLRPYTGANEHVHGEYVKRMAKKTEGGEKKEDKDTSGKDKAGEDCDGSQSGAPSEASPPPTEGAPAGGAQAPAGGAPATSGGPVSPASTATPTQGEDRRELPDEADTLDNPILPPEGSVEDLERQLAQKIAS